jgi:adenylate kinase
MLRAAVKAGTELGTKADEYRSSGSLGPDELVIDLVIERIAEDDCKDGFMLDGFPRTRPQAEALDGALLRAGVNLDVVLLIEVPDELIVERITGRRNDPETGEIYHVKFKPAPEEIQGRLTQRKDDTEEAVKARLSKYHAETAPIVPFYEDKKLLRRVDGVGTPAEVTERIADKLSDLS